MVYITTVEHTTGNKPTSDTNIELLLATDLIINKYGKAP